MNFFRISKLIRKLSLFFFFLLSGLIVTAQDSTVVKWKTKIQKINGNKYQLQLTGTIASGFHIYMKDSMEGIDGLIINYKDSSVKAGLLQYLSPQKSINDPVFENRKKQVVENEIIINQEFVIGNADLKFIKANIAYDYAKGTDYLQEEQSISIKLDENATESANTRLLIPSIDIQHPLNDCGEVKIAGDSKEKSSLWRLFLIGFLGGLVALLTPCVFPMIPLTVSFFTKKATSKKSGIKNAFLYGFFIFFIYVLLSLPFHFLDSINPEFLNNISTNVYLNIIFFVVFIFFALSFFGFYEITLPASFSTGADSKAGVGNILGIFFMALTLALVSFS